MIDGRFLCSKKKETPLLLRFLYFKVVQRDNISMQKKEKAKQKLTRKQKVAIIVSVILVGTFLLYFSGGVVAAIVVSNVIFEGRQSDETTLKELRFQKTRDDYEVLKDRQEVSFFSGKNSLKGYLYEVTSPKGLVIASHGMGSLADGNDAEYQQYFVTQGYDVFSFDTTAHGRSEGKDLGSVWQGAYDVKAALEYVSTTPLKGLPKILVGHSMGAYGVVEATHWDSSVKGVIAFSGFDRPNELMKQYAARYVSDFFVTMTGWTFDIGMALKDRGNATLSAFDAMKENQETKYLILQGEKDESVPANKVSLYSKLEAENLSNVSSYLIPEMGHERPWISLSSHQAMALYENQWEALLEEYHHAVPEEIESNFMKGVDLNSCNELNQEVFQQIETFLSTI